MTETEFCYWLQGYVDAGGVDTAPIKERLEIVLENRGVVRLLASGAVIDETMSPPAKPASVATSRKAVR